MVQPHKLKTHRKDQEAERIRIVIDEVEGCAKVQFKYRWWKYPSLTRLDFLADIMTELDKEYVTAYKETFGIPPTSAERRRIGHAHRRREPSNPSEGGN